MIKLLSFDGGGVLGVGPLQLMACYEKYTGKTIRFDALAGTSAGAIIAGMLSVGLSASESLDVFRGELSHIFKKRARLPWRSKYSGYGLKHSIENYIGSTRVYDLPRPIYIPYSDFKMNTPRVFDRLGGQNVFLSHAIRCSASAPTFFPPVDKRFCDGGLLANNPALIGAVGVMRELSVPINSVEIVSFGTGGYSQNGCEVDDFGIAKWSKPLVNFVLSGNERLVDFQCRQLNAGKYYRFCPDVSGYFALDAIDRIDEYQQIWIEYFTKNKTSICEALK